MSALPATIFELGLNHLGDPQRARRMIDTLVAAGATHVTLQVVTDPDRITRDPATIAFLRHVALPLDDVCALLRYASDSGLVAGATVLDPLDVPRLAAAGARLFKILSSDITYIPLVLEAAGTSYPTYLSTAAATLHEIGDVLAIVRRHAPDADLRLIHTVLDIPTPADRIDLNNITALHNLFGVPVAYGQHSDVSEALIVAAVIGADKLFVYVAEEPNEELPDGPHAVLCSDAAALLKSIRTAVQTLGCGQRIDSAQTASLRRRIRRSCVAAAPLPAGHILTLNDIAFKRPGTGVEPYHVEQILGQALAQPVATGDDLRIGEPE